MLQCCVYFAFVFHGALGKVCRNIAVALPTFMHARYAHKVVVCDSNQLKEIVCVPCGLVCLRARARQRVFCAALNMWCHQTQQYSRHVRILMHAQNHGVPCGCTDFRLCALTPGVPAYRAEL